MPVVEEVRQLTNDGNLKSTFSTIVSDGSRVYFDETDSGKLVSMQVSTTGGQATLVPTTFKVNSGIAGLTPDNSALTVFGNGFDTNRRLPEMIYATCLPLPGDPQQARSNCPELGQGLLARIPARTCPLSGRTPIFRRTVWNNRP